MFYSRVDRLVIQVLEVEMSVAQIEASDLFFSDTISSGERKGGKTGSDNPAAKEQILRKDL